MKNFSSMDETYILFDGDFMDLAQSIAKQIGAETISYKSYETESETHEWLTREFKSKVIKRLIIPLSIQSNDTDGLLVALHIRLNYELSIEQRTIPIIIITNLSMENIVTKSAFDTDNNPQNLLFTKGLSLASTDADDIIEKLNNTEPLNTDDYPLFLKSLSINRKATMGHHDMANAWGCYKLSQVVGNREIQNHPKIKSYLGQLYAKWLICQNNAFNTQDSITPAAPIKCEHKKILFIDDKADEGWGELMRYIFHEAGDGFVCIDAGKYKNGNFDYSAFYNECLSQIDKKWDLVLIDLRLNPEVEDVEMNEILPERLTGYQLVNKFLEWNAGFQIIAFTASNKIWNINAALRRGVRGYYIKESPLFNSDIKHSKTVYENTLVKDVEACLSRSYLYDFDEVICEFYNQMTKHPNNLCEEIYNQLAISFELISYASNKDQFAYAYVSLYLIIEILNRHLITDRNWILSDGSIMHRFEYDWNTKRYLDRGEYSDFANPSRHKMIIALILQEWKMPNGQILASDFHDYIDKRDAFIHKDESKLKKHKDIYSDSAFIKLFKSLQAFFPYIHQYDKQI